MADLKTMKGVSERDRGMIEDAERLLGPEPSSLGFIKNLFWGRLRNDLLFPYPEQSPEEHRACEDLLASLDRYLRTDHPAVLIDQEQEIPRWVVDRLFEIGVLGMTIPREYGGLGLGITSYNRVLERLGASCGSTAVLTSAHLSIGCGAIKLFGTDEQKQKWLPKLATEWLSAFCLSEPNVGCDAGGQETTFQKSADGQTYVINGEKKWATSGAISSLFTVMAREKTPDGKGRISALVCHPEMPGVDIFQKNRSKCGIRGTWQARIRFNDVHVPKFNLLHTEGKGLNVALSCLNYGRCTLSAGMLGGARRAMEQGIKWSQTRFQFKRPLADFELVRLRIARMAAFVYAMDAVLYASTGMLDRHDEDIMLETAVCKVVNSELGWRVVNDAMQLMGGESYMTENEIERIFRDSRINLIVEGANEVMQSFVFAYGGKQLAEQMLGVKEIVGWDASASFFSNLARISRGMLRPAVVRAALPLATEVFLGIRRSVPPIPSVDPSLRPFAERLSRLVREHTYQFKLASRVHDAAIIDRQAVQARIADAAIWLHAWACTLSRLDRDLRRRRSGPEFERDKTAAIHFFDLAELEIFNAFRALHENPDDTMRTAAQAALSHAETLPNSDFVIPEWSQNARGSGRTNPQDAIKQFPGDSHPTAQEANVHAGAASGRA